MVDDAVVERVARAICAEVGPDFDSLYESKREWIDDRGKRHDINVPYKRDFIEAARAAIDEFLKVCPECGPHILARG